MTKSAQNGIIIKVISGLRTYDEQNGLHAKGRTTPGKIVTNARGGYSNHNFGIAFDIGVFEGAAAPLTLNFNFMKQSAAGSRSHLKREMHR